MTQWRPLKWFCVSPGEYGLNISAHLYTDDGVRLLRTTDIDESGALKQEGAVYISPNSTGGLLLASRDILFSRSGTLGRTYVHRPEVEPMSFAGYLVRFRPNEKTDPRYLAYCAQAKSFHDQISADAVVSTISNFNAERYGNLRLPWHPFTAQQRIADGLDIETARIDALIAKKRRLSELLLTRASREIESRLRNVESPWLPLKRRWQVVDCIHRTPDYTLAGFPVVSPGDVTPGRLELSRAHRYVGDADFHDLTRDGRLPTRGKVVYSRNASIGIASYVDTDVRFCMGQDVCLITSTSQSELYLMYVLNTIGVESLDKVKIGSTFNRVNVSQIMDLVLPVPTLDEQLALASDFDAISARTRQIRSRLERQVRLLQEHRQALITAAVTGGMSVLEARR